LIKNIFIAMIVFFLNLIVQSTYLNSIALAQPNPLDHSHPDKQILRKNGQLVSLRIELGQPVRFFVVGREEAKIDSYKLSVRRLEPNPGKEIHLVPQGDHFILQEAVDPRNPFKLEVTAHLLEMTKKKPKSETFEINYKPTKP
jgi:hypothetical protein